MSLKSFNLLCVKKRVFWGVLNRFMSTIPAVPVLFGRWRSLVSNCWNLRLIVYMVQTCCSLTSGSNKTLSRSRLPAYDHKKQSQISNYNNSIHKPADHLEFSLSQQWFTDSPEAHNMLLMCTCRTNPLHDGFNMNTELLMCRFGGEIIFQNPKSLHVYVKSRKQKTYFL